MTPPEPPKAVSLRVDPRPPGSPMAVWAAFERQMRWKNWGLLVLSGLLVLALLANFKLGTRPPEYVLVENPGGQAVPVRRAVATDALLKFNKEKTRVPEITVVRFTRDFLQLTFAINSSTIEAAWPQALSMMTPAMRERVRAQAASQKLVETYKAAQVRSDLQVEDILLVERTPELLHVKATLLRNKAPLLPGTSGHFPSDHFAVDLVEVVVPPSSDHPDGLAVAEWQIQDLAPRQVGEGAGAVPTPAVVGAANAAASGAAPAMVLGAKGDSAHAR